MDITYVKDIASLIDEKLCASSLSWTAGGASDSVTWTGFSINREAFASPAGLPRSADFMVAYDVTLGSGKTFSLSYAVQSSPDNTIWTDYATLSGPTVIATGVSGGGKQAGIARMPNPNANAQSGNKGVDLNGAGQYVRFNVIPHLGATGTDTAVINTIGVFGGFDFLTAPTT